MTRSTKVRPYRLGIDTAEACDLEAAAFTEDYRRMGEDPRLEAKRESRVERVLSWAGRFVPSLRYARMGYVMEQDGRITSIALFSRDGVKGSRWSIDALGTHPDSQKRGMARQLLGHVFETIHDQGGEVCTLKVRQDNAAAYRLYQSLGFAHFHTSRQLKRQIRVPVRSEGPLDGLEAIKLPEWYSIWRERMQLAMRFTPSHVQEFKPVLETGFRRSRFIRALGPWVIKLSGVKLDQWILRVSNQLVATLRTRADMTGNRSHEIRLSIDPEWSSEFAGPLLRIALERLSQYPATATLVEVGGNEAPILEALKVAGFEEMSTWHWLGVQIPQASGIGSQAAIIELDNVTV
ncbi:GNAT family N-acetyltransferase [Candidatus Bipolaricaulota bacterium]